MATKLTQYIMSERFQEAVGRGVEKAVAELRAAGIEPVGSQVPPAKEGSRPRVIVHEAPKPPVLHGPPKPLRKD